MLMVENVLLGRSALCGSGVFLDGTNVNHELVKEGLAWHYRRYSSDKYYQQLELEARAKKKGLWSTKHIAPWNWRGGSR